jgi:hypothetical protein
VYVRGFPDPTDKVQISEQSGQQPRWSADGSVIYYWAADTLMAARVRRDPFAVLSRERVLSVGDFVQTGVGFFYDVHPDGRFVMIKPAEDGPSAGTPEGIRSLTLIVNWFAELEARMQSGGAAGNGGGG